jgi:hypothetical protein
MVAARMLWSQRQDIGPSPRVGHAITYDSIRERTTLFGGQRCGRRVKTDP